MVNALHLQALGNPLLKHYRFTNTPATTNLPVAFSSHLFQDARHRAIQSAIGWESFYVINEKHNRTEAQMHLNITEQTATSPLHAPYGGVDFSDTLPPEVLFGFLEYSGGILKHRDVTQWIIKTPPGIYNPAQAALLQTFLFNLGFQVSNAEVSTLITIDETPFLSKIEQWERRRINQAQQQGLQCSIAACESLQDIYTFIEQCRAERSYQLSISFENLKKTVQTFPDHFILFTVWDGAALAAASVVIKVTETVLYNFLSAHKKSYDHLSPVVLLFNEIYRYGAGSGLKLLDLGTSAFQGKPNFPLLDFKLRLGSIPASKLTFQKTLV